MKKHLLLSFLMILLALFFIACGETSGNNDNEQKEKEEVLAPTNLSVSDDVISFTTEAETVLCEIRKDGTLVKSINVQNGDSLLTLGLGLGTYEIKVKAVYSDKESEWTSAVNYEVSKLAKPTEVKIENSKLYFELVTDADKYNVIFVNSKGEETVKELKNGALLSNLELPADSYDVYVEAINSANPNATSPRSDKVVYNVELEVLDAPTGLYIEDEYLYFDVMASTNDYVVKFVKGNTVIEREVSPAGASIGDLVIPEGSYKVSIKAKGDGITYADSEYSEEIDYTKKVTVMELKEKDLINSGYVKWMGRTYYNEEKKVNEVYHSASGFEIFVKGFNVYATITATNYNAAASRPCIVIVIDDDFDNAKTIFLSKASQDVALMTNNNDALEHKIDLYKRSESIDSHIAVSLIKTDGIFIQKIEQKELKMEFIAASSSTGYGNLGTPSSSGKTTENSDALKGFAFLTAQKLNADINIFSASGWGCAFSQWTSPNNTNVPAYYDYVDFKSDIPWNSGKYIPDVVVVNLGTNDWSYINAATSATQKDQRMTDFQKAYVEFLKKLHSYYPDAQIVVLYGLMQESSIYEITESIVKNAKVFIPDLAVIKIVGDAGGYNSHPSAKRHAEIADELAAFIEDLLENK